MQDTIKCGECETEFPLDPNWTPPDPGEFLAGERLPIGECPECNWWAGIADAPMEYLTPEQRVEVAAPELLRELTRIIDMGEHHFTDNNGWLPTLTVNMWERAKSAIAKATWTHDPSTCPSDVEGGECNCEGGEE
jgi:hypothetical protein